MRLRLGNVRGPLQGQHLSGVLDTQHEWVSHEESVARNPWSAQPRRVPPDLPEEMATGRVGGSGQGFHPLSGEGLGQAELSPLVGRGAWWDSRSMVAVARVLGMSSSNPEGCRFEETAKLWRS